MAQKTNSSCRWTIATHRFPHLDEILAIWFLRFFGEERFSGIARAEIVYWETGGKTPDGRAFAEWEAEGYVFVGTGGGRFDEHPTTESDRKADECAASLVAKFLGLDGEPWLEKIIELVTRDDLHGNAGELGLGAITKRLHRQYPDDPELVMEWALTAIEAVVREQVAFWTEGKREFEAKAVLHEATGPRGQKLKIAAIESDSEFAGKFARSSRGGRAAVAILKRSTGNVQIFTNPKCGLALYDVVRMIRLAEQELKGGEMVTTGWKELSVDGAVAGAEEWFFQEAGQMLLNGSVTAQGVAPTKIPLERIVEIVKIGVSPRTFEPARASRCAAGFCGSTPQNNCPWYDWGLQRCREIRYEMRRSRKASAR